MGRKPKTLDTTLYCYVEKGSAEYAKTEGKRLFGSFSCYVNALICKDRGVKPKLGFWQSKNEARMKRERQERENERKQEAYRKKKAAK